MRVVWMASKMQRLGNDGYGPARVKMQLAALDWQMGRRAPVSTWGVPDDHDSGRPTGYPRSVTAGAVTHLCEEGQLGEAVEALGVLVQAGCRVCRSLFYRVIKRCVVQRDLVLGRRVHALTVEGGYQSDTFLCNHVLRMYSSHARLQEAMDACALVAKPDAFMWSSIISAHVKHGQDKEAIQLYHRMCMSSVKPDGHVFVAALQACGRAADLKTGQRVHDDVLVSGVEPDSFVCNTLVDMYAKCGSLVDARKVFDGLSQKNVVTWNALIAGYAQQGMGWAALHLYSVMQEGVVSPDSVTFMCLLQACAIVGSPALREGRQLHTQIREQEYQADVSVGNSLVNMYAKCGSLEEARKVFDGLAQKDVVTWTALMAGYSQQGMGQEALCLYGAMQEEGMAVPDSVTFVCLLQACASVGVLALEKGKQLHGKVRERGLEADVYVASSLVNMYAKCGSLEEARNVFDSLGGKNVVTWTTLIAGYSQQGMGQEALHLYRAMGEEGVVPPDSITFVCLLQACASVAALHVGRQLHSQIEDQGLQAGATLAIGLIDMYAKSGSMVDAQKVFDEMPERDVVAWTALIAGYTRQGDSEQVFQLVLRMKEECIQPDSVTLLSVLTVCSHTGLVNEGREYFEAMSGDYGITPTMEHYACMVDLLGRAGRLDEALEVVRAMPVQPDAAVWCALLGACQKWGSVEVGLHACDEAMKLDRKDAAAYVLMSNIYAGAQMWEEAQEMQARRTRIRAWKYPGQSWWTDMDGQVHRFGWG